LNKSIRNFVKYL